MKKNEKTEKKKMTKEKLGQMKLPLFSLQILLMFARGD
jgi:hypothetical protein